MSTSIDTTLLGVFLALSRSGGSMERNVVECGNECWTYGDLDVISTGLALDMRKNYGAKPTIAIVTENHPYVLATILATWKLGGIVAPLDHHVPRDILERMLHNISPTCVVVPSSERNLQNIIKDLSLTCLPFNAIDATITALSRRFLDQVAELSGSEYPLPTQDDIAFYLHTSSASSVSNVKCVPLTHKSVMLGSRGRLTWWEKTWPQHDYTHLRVLGWSPWSHIIGLTHDIGAATFLTAGCYVFAIIPSTYHTTSTGAITPSGNLDVAGQLLDTAMSKRTTAFAGVPWVLEGFKRTIETEGDTDRKSRMLDAAMSFKVFGSGGASTSPECLSWAKNINLPLVLDLGMTEVGGPLFHATIGGAEGWSSSDCMLPDANLTLIDEHGHQTSSEGELVIRSSFITTGYLHYDNRAFCADEAGNITFQTGDIYGYTPEQRLVWRGRKEDYIQMSSGESLDPREVETILNQCPVVARSCIVGNNFLKTSSQVVCAIVEPVDDPSKSSDAINTEITKAIASANRALAPPLRIGWTRVLVLKKGQNIPLTKKGAIFRKKLEELFGQQLSELLNGSGQGPASQADEKPPASANKAQGRTKDQVTATVTGVVTGILGISADTLEANAQATFAELGMDSSMATKIVNELNKRLDMRLPLNTCHTHIDLVSLTTAIIADLGLEGQSAGALPSIKIAPARELEEIVIVGEAVRLPGDINRTDAFWKALIEQRDDIMTPVPESRWDHASFYRSPTSTDPPGPCDITLTKAGFIDVAGFDHSFFGISSAEAFHVTPNIRLSLEIAFEALENANIPLSKIKGSNMGVFVASGMDESYIKLLFADKGWGAYTRFYGTGVATSTACGRISYLMDVHGPSYTVDTACSSGLIVMDNAVQYLQSGQGESAIVCGANTHTWPGVLGFLSAQKMTSSNSRCATFTNVADGYVPTEAAAGLILKTRSAALRDGDKILGVIRSTDVRHDGRSQGLVAPNVKAQIAMQIALLEKAGLAPSQIDFIESHGTGTSLGDLIEIEGINDVFKASHSPERPLVVGAAKSCVGHAETVSGLIGALKTLGSFSAGTVPGLVQLNADNMNPSLDCSIVPLHIPHETAVLKTDASRPLKGMILSNGFAGSIAGAILEAPSGDLIPPPAPPITQNIPMMFVVSAKSQEALAQYLDDYLDFCLNSPESSFHSICYTSCIGREHYRHRFACVATNMQDLIARLEDRIQSSAKNASGGIARRVLFAFPGQGSQYQGMGSYLFKQFSGFRTILTSAANKASALTGYPILPFLVDETSSGSRSIDQSEIAQVCIFLFQFAISVWLQDLGIQAQAVMGHSLGEIAAAVVAQTFTFEQGLQFVVERARILRADPEHPACMAAVAAPEDTVARYISKLGFKDRLVIAVYNAPEGHVVSGERKAVESLVSAVKMDGIRATKLNIDQGFHSPAIAPALPALKVWLDKHESTFAGLEKSLFSTVKGKEVPKNEILNSEYWVDHAKNPVRFVQAAREVHKSSVDVIVDVGPQPTIWTNMQTPEFSAKSRLAVTGKRGKDQIVAMLAALSSLFEKGITVDFAQLFEQMSQKFTKTQLPTYPFQRLHNYPSYIASRNSFLGIGPADKRPSTPSATLNQPHFSADQALCDFLDEHRIEGRRVLPGAAMADFFARASDSKSVKVIKFHKPLILETPDKQVRAEIDEKGSYKLLQKADRICSGTISSLPPPQSSKKVLRGAPEVIPLQMISKTQVYECFKNVLFGEQFHTVQQVNIWSDYADGDIQVESTRNPEHDRIRKLDACLHMFGAVASRLAPPIEDEEGAFLPTSLEDFTLHSNDLPNKFTCRYYLPLEITRNARLLSVAFDVFSEIGELLVSCRRYSVAWVPVGVVIPEQQAPADPDSWLRNGWNAQQLSTQDLALATHKFEDLVYLGHNDSRLLSGLVNSATNTVFVSLPGLSKEPKEHIRRDEIQTLSIGQMDALPAMLGGRDTLVVLDVTRAMSAPGESDFSELYLQILNFMRFIMTSKFKISSFVALTSWSAPVDLYAEGVDLFSKSQAVSTSLVGAVLQGMLRVFRRERGLDRTAWCLDFPNIDTLPEDTLQTIVMNEIQARYRSSFADTFVSYRQEASNPGLSRFVPTLQRISKVVPRAPSGTAIIIGMGSIGSALAVALVNSGCSKVVFFGRRPESNPEISKELSSLPAKAKDQCLYRQVDVCDFNSLKEALAEVNLQVGGIKNIIHTAAVVNDATITSTKPSSFEDVLRPKIIGSWNLHNASLELDLPLDSFVLFSSTNVLVGNPGQVAYVSANSFMDSLATYRHNSGLPATSLQLGAWESKLTDNIDMKESFAFLMKHKEGIPMIIKAMMVPIPVQVVARMDKEKLSGTPAYAKDPFFSLLLKSAPQPQPKSTEGHRLNKQDLTKVVLDSLRTALELQPNEKLDMAEPLTSCGADSITFAQFKGRIMQELEVDVPMVYLADSYTINDMIHNILESYAASSDSEPVQGNSSKLSKASAKDAIVDMLRSALDLQPSEKLDLAEPLTACGGDSITFAQFKGHVLKDLEVDVPMVYLSDAFSISDMITNILETYGASSEARPASQPSGKTTQSKASVTERVVDMLRGALDLRPDENLDLAEPLTACGGDSITFAQFKGQVLKELEVDVPMVYLSDAFTINDMITNILESCGSLSDAESTQAPSKPQPSKSGITNTVVRILRGALDLREAENLDVNEPLTSCGGDSITFAQFKGQVLKELGVDVPMVYLSDSFTINDMIINILESCEA